MWKRYRLWRVLWKLTTVQRVLESYAYDGDPAVWRAIRNIEALRDNIRAMTP